jgi:putative membrane protein insertion efficiency factor
MRRLIRQIAIAPLIAYKRVVSPLLGPRCRYYPSCSDYAIQAVREFGILRGLVLAGWRLLRCNPFSGGGLDPVSSQRLFAHGAHGADGSRTCP